MQRSLRDEGIVIIAPKYPTRLQATYNSHDSLQLRAGFTDALFIYDECLHKELVGELFELALIRYGCCEQKEAEADVGDFAFVVQGRRELMNQFKEGREAGFLRRSGSFGVGLVRVGGLFTRVRREGRGAISTCAVDTGCNEGREREADTLAAFGKMSPRSLKQLQR